MVRDLKPLHSALSEAINSLETFGGADLTQTLARIEGSLQAVTLDGYAAVLAECRAKAEVLGAAALVKRLASQINVVVHALGILLCLPRILRPGEAIDYVSLGAGNTGRAFDLETNQRIAEFKFIPPSDFPRGVAQRWRREQSRGASGAAVWRNFSNRGPQAGAGGEGSSRRRELRWRSRGRRRWESRYTVQRKMRRRSAVGAGGNRYIYNARSAG